MKQRPRLLFVAMADSVHTARYLSLLARTGWDVHLFPVYYCEPHPKMRNVTIWNVASGYRPPESDPSVTMRGLWPFRRGRILGLRAKLTAERFGFGQAAQLAALVKWLQPDLLHSLEFQHAGYLVEETKRRFGPGFPRWIATNWGSDIYAFGKLPSHQDRIRAVLAGADIYGCECFRDVALAQELGFRGEVMPVLPNTGGFDLDHCFALRQEGPPSARRVIAVKGYQYSFGRSLVALRALERTAPLLKDYKIVVYSPFPTDVVEVPAQLMALRSGLDVELLGHVKHDDILRLHGQSRLSISLSISDAICTSMTEAMVMGSFPIQSDSACADEWVEDGRSAFLVNADDSDHVAEKIRLAVTDDALIDQAAIINRDTALARLDSAQIGSQVIAAYENILGRQETSAA